MKHLMTHQISLRALLALAVLSLPVGLTGSVSAQPFYSIDFQGPTAGAVSAGDILLPAGPPPVVWMPEPNLGIVPTSTGHAEVDAISSGMDTPLHPATWSPRFFYSVDEFAIGAPGAPGAPNVATEGLAGNREASADIYANSALLPLAPIFPGAVFSSSGIWDGDGIFPFGGAFLGLVEPNPPNFGALPDFGDNLDAMTLDKNGDGIYFSLDAGWQDPLEVLPANSGTAAANGFAPGDILFSDYSGAPPVVFANFFQLGLGPFDDLDALILWENGNGAFDLSPTPFDWITEEFDMVLFSVRRRSPITGTPDAFWGVPIEEGDVLMPTAGGVPGIFIPAEALGLATVRSGWPLETNYGDDLDALSVKN